MSPPGANELEKVARGGAANLVGAAVNGVAGFLLVLVVTRLLDQSDAGTFFTLTSIFLILLAAVELGATTGLVKWIPHYLASGRERDLRQLLRTALIPVLLVSGLVAMLIWPLAPWLIGLLTHDGRGTRVGPDAFRVIALFLPLAACYDLLLAATRGFDRIRPTVLVERIGRVPGQLVLVLLAAVASHQVLAVSIGWAVPYLPGLLVAGWLSIRLLLLAERRARKREADAAAALAAGAEVAAPRRPPAPRTARRRALPTVTVEFWRYTWARGLSRIFQVALQRLDIVLISVLLTTREAAIYTAATRLVPVGLLGVVAVQQVLQPQLSKLLALEDLPAAQRIYRASTSWSMAVAWPIYCAAAVFAPAVLRLFGEGYEDGAAAMIWVSCAMLVAVACGAADLALLMSGRSTLSLWNTAVALAANVLLNLLLLPRIGITGAAIAWAVSILLTNLPPLIQVRRYVGLVPFSRGAALVAASTLTFFGAGSYGVTRLFGDSLAAMVLWLLVAGLLYLAVLYRAHSLLELGSLVGAVRGRRGGGPVGGPGGGPGGGSAADPPSPAPSPQPAGSGNGHLVPGARVRGTPISVPIVNGPAPTDQRADEAAAVPVGARPPAGGLLVGDGLLAGDGPPAGWQLPMPGAAALPRSVLLPPVPDQPAADPALVGYPSPFGPHQAATGKRSTRAAGRHIADPGRQQPQPRPAPRHIRNRRSD